MTHEECRKRINDIITSSSLEEVIEILMQTKMVNEMLDGASQEYVPRAILAAALLRQYHKIMPLSETCIELQNKLNIILE